MLEKLFELLKGGQAKTIEMLAIELDTTVEDIERQLEYLEHMGVIRKVTSAEAGCGNCGSCHSKEDRPTCDACMPENGFENMGQIWEVVEAKKI
ncbi:MAG: hypothetical protein K5819_05665 [Lachnospiraceae bacterium]|nr:hypothetical protein [Lachnospiraceae bacterium]